MLDIIVWVALMMSIGTGALAVWVFSVLVSGAVIVGDKYTLIELTLASAILCLLVAALIGFTARKLRE
ncbi:hypothetical protein LCGC14_0384630 [marine sediment metagenome]|uniref:Uncharacterized protein n=1 Tax=marine sediment metagenome TaxID=412755 RepID=A0A0F9VNA6_9ZZZZ